MLSSTGLGFSYNQTQHFTFPDVSVAKGEHALLLGKSGKGKTTFLHLLAGLLRPDAGTVSIQGTDIVSLSPTEMDHFRGKHIGIIFQQAHFVGSLTIEENLQLAQSLAKVPVDRKRIHALLDRLQIVDQKKKRPHRLSVGERQRAAIARAIINGPSIILADEPTSALDDENAEEVIQLLNEQAAEVDASLLIVTHDQRLKDVFANRIEL